MKDWPLILKHLRHGWVRTASTVLAICVCIFLFCTLEAFIEAINWGLKSASANRLITRHNVSLAFPLPHAYREKIASLPGVKRVATSNWFFGVYQGEMKNFFPNFAVDAAEYMAIYPEYEIREEERKAFLEDLRGCVVGRDTAKKFGWEVGDVFQLESRIPGYRKAEPFEFVVRAIYDVDEKKHPWANGTLMFFHYKYLYEGTGQRVQAGTYITEIEDSAQAVPTAAAIDERFESSDAPTKSETEAAFRAGFVSMGGNLALLLYSIGLAVTFTILLVTANTMSMAIRERRTEIGILKTLGFSNLRVLGIVLSEATLLGILGGATGIVLGHQMIQALPHLPLIGDAVRGFPRLGLSLPVAALGFSMALLLGFLAGLVPAILSYRARVTQLLRQV